MPQRKQMIPSRQPSRKMIAQAWIFFAESKDSGGDPVGYVVEAWPACAPEFASGEEGDVEEGGLGRVGGEDVIGIGEEELGEGDFVGAVGWAKRV